MKQETRDMRLKEYEYERGNRRRLGWRKKWRRMRFRRRNTK